MVCFEFTRFGYGTAKLMIRAETIIRGPAGRRFQPSASTTKHQHNFQRGDRGGGVVLSLFIPLRFHTFLTQEDTSVLLFLFLATRCLRFQLRSCVLTVSQLFCVLLLPGHNE